MKAWCTLGCIATLVLAPTAHSWDRQPGPIAYRNQSPIYIQFGNITPTSTQALPRSTKQVAFRQEYSNIFEFFTTNDHEVRLDAETLRVTIDLAYGLGSGFTLEGEIPMMTTWGGFLDPFLSWYHQTLGLPNSGRTLVSNNVHDMHITDRVTNTELYRATSGTGLSDIIVRLRHETLPETPSRPAIGWFVQTDLPTGNHTKAMGNGNVDVGMGILLEKSSRRWYGFTNVGYFLAGAHAELDNVVRTEMVSFVTGGALRVSRPLAVHVQIHGGSPMLKNIRNMRWNDMPLDLMVGMSGDHPDVFNGNDLMWQVGFSEDLHANGPSIDFTAQIQAGIRWNY